MIKHNATVTNKTKTNIQLQMDNIENCGSCPISSFCNIAKTENISLSVKYGKNLKIGDNVHVYISKRAENMGILLSYVLPTIIIFVSLSALKAAGLEDTFCALFTLCFLVFYGLLLFLLRNKIMVDLKIEVSGEKENE